MRKIKRFDSFIKESNEETSLKEIVEECEDIVIGLDFLGIESKIFCHKLGLTDPKYLGNIKRTYHTIGYEKTDTILFHLKSNNEFKYEDIKDTIEHLKSYLTQFGYRLQFIIYDENPFGDCVYEDDFVGTPEISKRSNPVITNANTYRELSDELYRMQSKQTGLISTGLSYYFGFRFVKFYGYQKR